VSAAGETFIGIDLPAGHRLVSVAEEPALWRPADDMCGSVWPEFMLHDPAADRNWAALRDEWPEFQLVLLDSANGIAAAAQAAPLRWDGSDDDLPEGWDAQFDRSTADLQAGRTPNTLGAIQICVAPGRRGQGISGVMVEAMRAAGIAAGFHSLIACVRPTEKVRYPLMPIAAYAAWCRPDGLPFDPWLRVHARAGARIVRAAPHSMTISGTVAEWQEWTGLSFPVSGPYVVSGALAPVEMDLEAGSGVYHDPNVWMVHRLA
jgi:GNAT superfamily N-acetyltransferase